MLQRILGLNGHVVVQALDSNLPDYDAVAARVRKVNGVVRVAPIIDGQVMATANGANSGVLVRGMRCADLEKLKEVSSTLSSGALARFQGGDSVIIGARLADKLRIVPGMDITLIAPEGDVTPFGTTPRIKTYKVAGTFRIGMSEYDATYVFMPLAEAQLYFNMPNLVSGIEVMVTNPDQVKDMVNPIGAAAGPAMRSYMAGHQLIAVWRWRWNAM